jgi:UDPglucose 6-dehydrogenase
MNNVKKLLGDKITFTEDPYDSLEKADALIICTEWSLFRTPDFEKVSAALKNKVIFDGRNLYAIDQMRKLGYYYSSIGRETVK